MSTKAGKQCENRRDSNVVELEEIIVLSKGFMVQKMKIEWFKRR